MAVEGVVADHGPWAMHTIAAARAKPSGPRGAVGVAGWRGGGDGQAGPGEGDWAVGAPAATMTARASISGEASGVLELEG